MQMPFPIFAFLIHTLFYRNATRAWNKGWRYWNFQTKQSSYSFVQVSEPQNFMTVLIELKLCINSNGHAVTCWLLMEWPSVNSMDNPYRICHR